MSLAAFGANKGTGDKQVLRECLRILGLPRAAERVKRAIQFGSRIGKKANLRDFGSNRRANKVSAGSVKLQDVPSMSVAGVGDAAADESLKKQHN